MFAAGNCSAPFHCILVPAPAATPPTPGLPVYAKGSNLIPLHVLPTSATPDALTHLLDSALAANMNMMRIWGGGRYADGALYDYADEKGLLIWQELMFACTPYPRWVSALFGGDD